MKRRKEPFLKRLFLSFVLATVLFIFIFLFAYFISYSNYKGISSQNNVISESLDRLDFILNEGSCDDELLLESSKSLDIVGSKLSLLEKRFGNDDIRVLEQKNLYTDLEVKHFNIIKNFNENCGRKFITFFFFYSNIGDKQDKSELMGSILGSFKIKNGEKVMVYSFDFNLDYTTIKELIDEYNVTEAPIVVAEESEFIYVRNIDDLDAYFSNI